MSANGDTRRCVHDADLVSTHGRGERCRRYCRLPMMVRGSGPLQRVTLSGRSRPAFPCRNRPARDLQQHRFTKFWRSPLKQRRKLVGGHRAYQGRERLPHLPHSCLFAQYPRPTRGSDLRTSRKARRPRRNLLLRRLSVVAAMSRRAVVRMRHSVSVGTGLGNGERPVACPHDLPTIPS